jgi:hypothetical protein
MIAVAMKYRCMGFPLCAPIGFFLLSPQVVSAHYVVTGPIGGPERMLVHEGLRR